MFKRLLSREVLAERFPSFDIGDLREGGRRRLEAVADLIARAAASEYRLSTAPVVCRRPTQAACFFLLRRCQKTHIREKAS